jgi:hypothetical protein
MKQQQSEKPIISIVLLLRKPYPFTKEELRAAAENAWRVPFAGDPDTKHFVMPAGKVTLVKSGAHLLSVLAVPKPYFDDPEEVSKDLPEGNLRNAWAEHRAWIAVDYVKGGRNIEMEYAVIARLVTEMLDLLGSNCTGAYIPAEEALFVNDLSLHAELERIAGNDQRAPN